MISILQSPFFLLFFATSGVGAYLGHRIFVLGVKPRDGERWLAMLAAGLSLALCVLTYCIRFGKYTAPHIDVTAASVVAAVTGLAVAFVCIFCVLGGDEVEDEEKS